MRFFILLCFLFVDVHLAQSMTLTPEFQAKFFLRKAEKMIKHRHWKGVARALGKYDSLLNKHGRDVVSKPPDFYFHYAYSLCEVGKFTGCYKKATEYLRVNGENAQFAGHAHEMIKDLISIRIAISPRWAYLKASDCAISYNNMNQDEMTLYARPDQVCSIKFHKAGYESQNHTLVMSQTPSFTVDLRKLPEEEKPEQEITKQEITKEEKPEVEKETGKDYPKAPAISEQIPAKEEDEVSQDPPLPDEKQVESTSFIYD